MFKRPGTEMLKSIATAILLVCATFSALARDYTIVEKDTFGTGPYVSGAIVEGHAFVASELKKVEQFNLKDPSNLVKLPDTNLSCIHRNLEIIADGNVLAVRCAFFIEFYDASDPENISLIGIHDSTGARINGFDFKNGRLYVLANTSDLIVFDATDLANIKELGRTDIGSSSITTSEVKIYGDHLYVMSSINSLEIYDVSDPTSPTKVVSFPAVDNYFYEIVVIGNFAYIGAWRGIQVLDVSNKSAPILVTEVVNDENSSSVGGMRSLDYDGTHFIGIGRSRDIRTIDISNPSSPVISAPKLSYDYSLRNIKIDGNTLALFGGIGGISTIDISNTNEFTELGHFTQSMKPYKISLDGDAALVTGSSEAYHVIDIDSELNISERGRMVGYSSSSDGMLNGNTIYVNNGNVLSTLDITDIDNLIVTDTDTLAADWAISQDYEKSGNQLIVGMISSAGEVVGIYDFDSIGLTEVSSINLGSNPDTSTDRRVLDIVKKANYLYVATEETDASIIDVSDLANPSISHYDWSNEGYGNDRNLEIFGNRLFIARDSGLETVDITDPSAPKFIESNPDFSTPENIQAIDERYGVINNSRTLYLVDFEDETNPKIVHQISSNSQFTDIVADQSKIITADRYDFELRSFQINQGPISKDSTFKSGDGLTLNSRVDTNDREGDVITVSVIQNVNHGELTLNNDGSFDYTPNTDFIGEDSFQYTAEDEHGGSSSATVTIIVEKIFAHEFEATENTMFFGQVTETGLEGDKFKFKILVKPTNGKIVFKSSGKFKYLANPDFVGEDTFEYAVSNGTDFSDNKTVKINVSESD